MGRLHEERELADSMISAVPRHKDHLYLMAFVLVTIVFWTALLVQRRDVSDTWILEGLEPFAIAYIVIFAITVTRVRAPGYLVLVSSIFLWTFGSIPGAKYELPYGYSDEAGHFLLISALIDTGEMPLGSPYTNVPGLHVYFAITQTITNLALPELFGFWLPLLYVSVPGIVYFAAKRMTENVNSIKMAVVAASLLTLIGYRVNPMVFSLPLVVLYFALLYLRIFKPRNLVTQLEIMLILVTVFLVATHSVTALVLILATIGVAAWMAVRKRSQAQTTYKTHELRTLSRQVLLVAVIFLAWWALVATFVFDKFVSTIYDYVVLEYSTKPFVPVKLATLPFTDQISVFLLFHARDVLVLSLLLVGTFLLWMNRREGIVKTASLVAFLGGSIVVLYAIIGLQYILNFGSIEYARFLLYVSSLMPLFVMLLATLRMRSRLSQGVKRQIATLGIIAFLGVSIIQVFPYQPLAPRSDAFSTAPPLDDYLFSMNEVNTVYQLKMIQFASLHSACGHKVTSDIVTRNQIKIFGSACLQANQLYASPLMSEGTVQWDLFMLHWPGRAGPLKEPPEVRDTQAIGNLRDGFNLVYTNGESFVLGYAAHGS